MSLIKRILAWVNGPTASTILMTNAPAVAERCAYLEAQAQLRREVERAFQEIDVLKAFQETLHTAGT